MRCNMIPGSRRAARVAAGLEAQESRRGVLYTYICIYITAVYILQLVDIKDEYMQNINTKLTMLCSR